ncbi:hypothetical protein BGW36DRAFT_367947 [Talaromyces proteolyticus]|uniref:WSC domain-containing protein n=1 Tax=Talaromyces proteolyticus TaxID=1131652 RepID=A0AAD4Q6H2_9EURO|nr:uncharacterized protein BGW36DRAFT_367947 [Talaromyces proteolyticus]KAH8705643.1 hypothetical protein BGW36DRAFT_367947 [Talaromyces proteolyticus]
MKNFQQAVFLSAAALFSLIAAECDVVPLTVGTDGKGNSLNIGDVLGDQPDMCDSQGDGQYTFVMTVAMGGLPIPGGPITPGFPGYVSSASYMIFDNGCKLLGAYSPNGDCNSPYTLEDNYLADVMTIQSFTDVGDPSFTFYYGNGKFSTGNNHCGCATTDDSLTKVAAACKCAFPQNGVLSKRGFQAIQYTG